MVESRCFLSFLRDERKEKERKEKKKKVEKRECEKNTRAQKKEEKKEIVTLFLYTRKAQNRRRIHRVVAVYPVTNGTEFRWQIFFLSTMLKNIWKNSRDIVSSKGNEFETRSKHTYYYYSHSFSTHSS